MYVLPNVDGSIRLISSSSPLEGRVEIYYAGEWGTICETGWNNEDARVVCRQLGYRDGEAREGGFYGSGEGTVWLELVDCYGDESVLVDCPAANWGSNSCEHSKDVGVFCEV